MVSTVVMNTTCHQFKFKHRLLFNTGCCGSQLSCSVLCVTVVDDLLINAMLLTLAGSCWCRDKIRQFDTPGVISRLCVPWSCVLRVRSAVLIAIM